MTRPILYDIMYVLSCGLVTAQLMILNPFAIDLVIIMLELVILF